MQEYFEDDNFDRETIEMYERMPDEERRALIDMLTAEAKRQMENIK